MSNLTCCLTPQKIKIELDKQFRWIGNDKKYLLSQMIFVKRLKQCKYFVVIMRNNKYRKIIYILKYIIYIFWRSLLNVMLKLVHEKYCGFLEQMYYVMFAILFVTEWMFGKMNVILLKIWANHTLLHILNLFK